MPMRQFNLKGEWLIPHPGNESDHPGRTITPEPMRMAEPGWVQRGCSGETVQRREALRAQPVRGTGENGEVTDEERDAAREWLRHVEAGRIGGRR